jgi:hypothetical protein
LGAFYQRLARRPLIPHANQYQSSLTLSIHPIDSERPKKMGVQKGQKGSPERIIQKGSAPERP